MILVHQLPILDSLKRSISYLDSPYVFTVDQYKVIDQQKLDKERLSIFRVNQIQKRVFLTCLKEMNTKFIVELEY